MTSNKKISCETNLTESQKIRNKELYKAGYKSERELEEVIKGLNELVSSFSSKSPEKCVDYVDALLLVAYRVSELRISRINNDEEERKESLLFACKVSKQMRNPENFFNERARRGGIILD